MSPRASATAQHVALARSHMTWLGIVDDPYAATMLRPLWRRADRALRWGPLRRPRLSTAFAFLGTRTCFFDDEVRDGIDAGAAQVVVVAAGYDSRAWRLGRDGVTFFEVDHGATQADKRSRAPAGGPTYVTADLSVDDLAAQLAAAGFDPGAATVFTVEGLTMYLTEEGVIGLLSTLRGLAPAGSRLVINFRDHAEKVGGLRTLVRAGGEQWHFGLPAAEGASFLDGTGWELRSLLSSADLADRYLVGTSMAKVPLDAGGWVASAVSRGTPG